jgi:hypothetical protein
MKVTDKKLKEITKMVANEGLPVGNEYHTIKTVLAEKVDNYFPGQKESNAEYVDKFILGLVKNIVTEL